MVDLIHKLLKNKYKNRVLAKFATPITIILAPFIFVAAVLYLI